MKKNLSFYGMLLALFAASCSNDEMNEIPELQQDAITVTAGLDANTRVNFSQDGNVTHAFWDADDQITLYAASQGGMDYQVATIGEGGSSATFAPVADVLRNTDEAIYATYPATTIKEGKATLPATNVWTDEKPLPFAYATSKVEEGSVNLSFSHLFAYLKLTLNAETTVDEVTSLYLSTTSSEALSIKEGIFDFESNEANLVEGSNGIYFRLQESYSASADSEKSFYIPILPQPAGETITLNVLREHEAGCDTLLTISKETPSSGFLAGRAYTYSPKTPWETNEIILSTAGTLATLIPETAKDTITKLKIIGPMNGDDIRLIREMAGRDVNSNETEGKLTDLDISEATIVEGGGMYCFDCFTTMNQLGDYMFELTILKNILLPTNLTSIGDNAFYRCSSLTSVTVGNAVTSIGGHAFSYCSSLTSVDIPDSVTSIADDAFANCSKLTSITIPDNVTSLGSSVFEYCSSLASVTIGNSVTSIGDNAFYRCSSLTSVTIGNAVTSIGGHAFYYCSSLASVDIPDSVTSIGDGAFADCSKLTSITIPDNVTSLGSSVFYNCSSLASVTIGNSVTSIGGHAFYYCSSLASVDIPDSVTSIGNYAFYSCSSLASVTIGNGVSSIGDNAFTYCNSLRSIIIPDAVTTIGDYAFDTCSSLRFVKIGNGVTSIGDDAFNWCFSLTSVDIPDSVTSIGKNAFHSCSSLKSVTIGNDLIRIGFCAFVGCDSLSEVYISDLSAWCMISFGDDAANPLCYGAKLYLNNVEITELVIPDDITEIKDYAFAGSSLRSITIPDTITFIGNSAFGECSSLSGVYISDLSAWCRINFNGDKSNPLRYGAKLYLNNVEITELVIPDDITEIKGYAFAGSSLTSIAIHDGVTDIVYAAFEYCNSLTSVTIGKGVTVIGNYAFYSCSSLASVTIGKGVYAIGRNAFNCCSLLSEVTCNATTPPELGSEAFSDIASTSALFVPNGCSTAYSKSDWAQYFDTIEEK